MNVNLAHSMVTACWDQSLFQRKTAQDALSVSVTVKVPFSLSKVKVLQRDAENQIYRSTSKWGRQRSGKTKRTRSALGLNLRIKNARVVGM